MKKNDTILIFVVLFISLICFIFMTVCTTEENLKASVYIENELVYEVYLEDITETIIKEFDCKEGVMTIEISSEGVVVVEDCCTYHICSNQGLISRNFETIICVPNEFYVKLSQINSNEVVVG